MEPSTGKVLQDTPRTETGQSPQSSAGLAKAQEQHLHSGMLHPVLILGLLVLVWHKEISTGAIPAPLEIPAADL